MYIKLNPAQIQITANRLYNMGYNHTMYGRIMAERPEILPTDVQNICDEMAVMERGMGNPYCEDLDKILWEWGL